MCIRDREWEREFLMEKQADVNMTFESFVALSERDICLLYTSSVWKRMKNLAR